MAEEELDRLGGDKVFKLKTLSRGGPVGFEERDVHAACFTGVAAVCAGRFLS